jgi:hypothetical protein
MGQQRSHLVTVKVETRHAPFQAPRSNQYGKFRVGVRSYKCEDRGCTVGSIAVTSMADRATVGKRSGGAARLLSQERARPYKQ